MRRLIRSLVPEVVLEKRRRWMYHPRLRAMGIEPTPGGPFVEHFGTPYGRYNVDPRTIGPDSAVYALGAGEDISFEQALAQRTGCAVHVYDPTPRSLAWLEDLQGKMDRGEAPAFRMVVHPMGLWSERKTLRFYAPLDAAHVSYSLTNMQGTDTYIEVPCVPLAEAMRENGDDRIDLLKLNVEGAEYAILHSAFDDGLLPRIITINFDEVHTQGDAEAPARLQRLASRIFSLGYRVVHAELCRATFER